MEEDEAAGKLCKKLICVIRSKQQHLHPSSEEMGAGVRQKSECKRGEVKAGDELRLRDHRVCNLSLPPLVCSARETGQPSTSLTCQGSTDRPVPPQIILNLRLKTLKEEMRRKAAEVELHDPAVCSVCEQEQASLALRSFISRKKTQLHVQRLMGRLNTALSFGESGFKDRGAQYRPYTCHRPLIDDICLTDSKPH